SLGSSRTRRPPRPMSGRCGLWQGNDRCCPHADIEHRNGTGWGTVSSPDPNPNATLSLTAIAAISASDIRTAGFAIEDWDGTSWTIVSSPAFGKLEEGGVLRDGTVVAVSYQGFIMEK